MIKLIAPGDYHLIIDEKTTRIKLDDGPKENFVRPAADPLFRSIVKSFGKYSIGVVLTGLGRDGATGIAQVNSIGGKIIIQDPKTAVADSMPNSAIKMDVDSIICSPDKIADHINNFILDLKDELSKSA